MGCGAAFAIGAFLRERPFVGLLFGFRPSHSITLLNSSDQLILLAGDCLPVVIREFPPALASRAGELLPLTFDLVPIHGFSLSSRFPGITDPWHVCRHAQMRR